MAQVPRLTRHEYQSSGPRRFVESQRIEHLASTVSLASPVRPPGCPMSIRVLVVDDNEVFRRPLQRALEAAGFEVVAVSSAEDALEVLHGSTVDVLLTDHRLPGMDGVQLITRIKATHPALAIIVMTAYG